MKEFGLRCLIFWCLQRFVTVVGVSHLEDASASSVTCVLLLGAVVCPSQEIGNICQDLVISADGDCNTLFPSLQKCQGRQSINSCILMKFKPTPDTLLEAGDKKGERQATWHAAADMLAMSRRSSANFWHPPKKKKNTPQLHNKITS